MNIINDVLVDKLFPDKPKRTKEIPLLSEKTASGDGMIVINDAYSDFPIKNLTLQGNTQQNSTTGKNLWSAENNIEVNEVREIVLDFEIPAGDYVVSSVVKSNDTSSTSNIIIFYGMDSSKAIVVLSRGNRSSAKVNFEKNVNKALLYAGRNNSESEGDKATFSDFQIEKGTAATPYEPYTGGKPSPSPDYPQEIKSVGKLNELTGKYEVDVRVTGKNLFDVNNMTFGYYNNEAKRYKYELRDGVLYSSGITGVNSGESFVIKSPKKPLYLKAKTVGEKANIHVFEFDSLDESSLMQNRKTLITQTNLPETINIKMNQSNKEYIGISFYSAKANGAGLKDIMISIEDVLYEPYKEQTLTITSDRPITKWDKLVEQDGQIGWLYGGTVKEYADGGGMSLYNSGFSFRVPGKKIVNGEGYCEELCSRKCVQGMPNISFKNAENEYAYTLNTQAIYGSTVSEIREYLKQHPLHLAYQTEATEFISLPQSEQDAIRALKTYYPTTVITVDGGELPVGIEVTYMKPEYIPTKQSALRMWFKENPII